MPETDHDALCVAADQLEKILFPNGDRMMTYAFDSRNRARQVVRDLSIDDFHELRDILDARAYFAQRQADRWKAIREYADKEAALPTRESSGANDG